MSSWSSFEIILFSALHTSCFESFLGFLQGYVQFAVAWGNLVRWSAVEISVLSLPSSFSHYALQDHIADTALYFLNYSHSFAYPHKEMQKWLAGR